MKLENSIKRLKRCRYLIVSVIMLFMLGIGMQVLAAGKPSNLLAQIQPYYTYRCKSGSATLAGEVYDDCLLFDTYNNITGEAAFYLEGKYSSISFSAGHENGKQARNVSVYCDDKLVWASDILSDDLPKNSGIISLQGVKELKFIVSGSSSVFNTAIGNINLVSNGYTREERMKTVASDFLTNVQAYNSKRYSTGHTVMGDKNYENAIRFDSYNSVEAHAAYNLQGNYKDLSFWLGNDMNSVKLQTRTVTITGDGTKLYERAVAADDAPVFASISVAGVHQLKITVSGTASMYNVVFGGMNLTSDGRVRGISLDNTILKLNAVNPSSYLKPVFVPADASDQKVFWSSSNEAVATVNEKGLVTAVMDGTAVITAKTSDGGYTASCEVTVTGMTIEIKHTGITVQDGVYSGNAVKPAVTVTYSGTVLQENRDYVLSYSNNTNAGNAKVEIKGTGKYKGSVTKSFTIAKAEQSLQAAMNKESVVSGKTAQISVVGKGNITYSTDNKKTATVSNTGTVKGIAPGTAVVMVKASGDANYNAAETSVIIEVRPKSTKIVSARNDGRRKIAVKWKKVSGVSGYQVKYVTGSSSKTKSVKKASTVSRSLTSLKKGKTYKIYVRSYKTVKGVKYYSDWSKVKKVKVRK